jgi:hypothetical protein
VRVGEHQPALAAGEEPREDALELRRRVQVGLGEDLLDPLVDFADDVEQVALGGAEVLELGGEEGVALLEGGELLEASGLTRPRADSPRSARAAASPGSSRT